MKGRSKAQKALNQAIDDLLGGDDDDIITPKANIEKMNVSSSTKKNDGSRSPKKSLTSDASSKDFYSSLSTIAGHDISEGNDEEDIKVDAEDAANIAKSLADMDDLESDLFGSFIGKKTNKKPKADVVIPTAKHSKRKEEFSDFDEDDPLAGLGLSDEEDILSKKSKPRKPDLSRKLSHTSSKGKVDPNLIGSNSQEPDPLPHRSSSFDREDPFLATDPRPRSGSNTERKVKRMNSWDEPSIGTQSESEHTPRSRSNSGGQQIKHSRKGSKKKKINPSPNENNNNASQEDSVDLPDTGMHQNPSANDNFIDKETAKVSKPVDDMFADEDDLPGWSDNEISPTKKPALKEFVEDTDSTRNARTVLDDLLEVKSKTKEGRKPTFLEQMMSKGSNKHISSDVESPVTSPPEKDITFGGYTPSVGGTKERPTTAPSRRTVRFADELGFDELDVSLNESRPSTAPGSRRSTKPNSRLKDATIGSSFEDDNTDISLDLSTSEFRRPSLTKATGFSETNNGKNREQHKEKNTKIAEKTSKNGSSPRRSLQNSRRKSPVAGAGKQTGPDDRRGRDEDKALHDGKDVVIAKAALDTNNDKKLTDKKGIDVSQDDWLGLNDEYVADNWTQNEKQLSKHEESLDLKAKVTGPSASNDDELLPWETLERKERQRRRNNFKEGTNAVNIGLDDSLDGSVWNREEPSTGDRKRDQIAHSTPVDTKSAGRGRSKLEQENKLASTKVNESLAIEGLPSFERKLEGEQQRPTFNDSQNFGPVIVDNAVSSGMSKSGQKQTAGNETNNQPHFPNVNVDISDKSIQQVTTSTSLDSSVIATQMERIDAEKALQQRKILENELLKSQYEKDLKTLETELRTFRSKVLETEEKKWKMELEFSKKIEDLEEKIRKLQAENDQLKSSQDILKKRQTEELQNMENSYKMRFEFLDETYQRRETQIKADNEFVVKQLNERIKALELERNEIMTVNKERLVMVERNKDQDIDRIKGLHKKAIDELSQDYEEQLKRLHLLKEQEVSAATSVFSHTKSLQSLMQQVQSSTKEVEQIQKRIDLSHKETMNEREQSLKVKDEFLKSLQERLQRQEAERMEERSNLQTLVARLEMQLREQGRHLEQDKWKIVNDENRLKSMQASIEEERRYTMQQLNSERQMIDKARDDLMNEQRKILTECYEEQRRTNALKAELETNQSKYNKDSLAKEFDSVKERQQSLSKEEKRLEHERQMLEEAFKNIAEERDKLEAYAKQIQNKSKEVERLSKEAVRIQQDGINSLEHAHQLKLEASNTSELLENKAVFLDHQERELSERLTSLETAKMQFESSKGSLRCIQCQKHIPEVPKPPKVLELMTEKLIPNPSQEESHLQQQRLAMANLPSPASSLTLSSITAVSSLSERQQDSGNISHSQPPDVVIGSLNFNRTLRKWSSDKEQDEEFFEEESRFLNEIQKKRETNISYVSG